MFAYLLPLLLLISSQALGMKRPATQVLNQEPAKIQRGTSYSKELEEALHKKDMAQALALIEKLTPATVNDTREDGYSALIDAIRFNSQPAIKMLLAKGALPYTGQDSPITNEFLIAVITHNAEKVSELLELGVDVNVTSDFDFNPLLFASALGYENIVKILLQHPLVNVHACTVRKTDALMYAAMDSHIGVMDLLIKAGINHDFRNVFGCNALMLALQSKQITAARYLLALPTTIDLNITNTSGCTLLMYAAVLGNIDIISALINKGADIHAVNNGDTALTIAVQNKQNEAAKLLIDAGAKTDIQFKNGATLLIATVTHSTAQVTEKLLTKGAVVHINTPNEGGCTPLMWAANFGYIDIMKVLLAHGADIHAVSKNRSTALSIALDNQKNDAAKLLLAAGAKANITFENDQTLLLNAVPHCTPDIIKKLLDNGAAVHINTPNKNGWTPLMRAARFGNVDTMRLLLAHNADIEAVTTTSATALCIALYNKQNEASKLLIKSNAKTDMRLNDGETMLSLAAAYCNAEIVEMLLQTNARIHINTLSGLQTPLVKALIRADLAIANLLITHGATVYNLHIATTYLIKNKCLHCLEMLAFMLQHTTVSSHYEILKGALTTAHDNQNLEVIPWILSKLTTSNLVEKPYIPQNCRNTHKVLASKQIHQFLEKKQKYEKEKDADVALNISMLFKFYKQPSLNEYLASGAEYCNNSLTALDTTNTYVRYAYNQTPVMWASIFGHLDTTQKIISHLFSEQVSRNLTTFALEKLDPIAMRDTLTNPRVMNALKYINAQDACGRTALMYAIMYGHFDIAQTLLPYALSSICLKDKTGKTALTYAIQKRNTDLIEAILKYYTILNNHLKSNENFFRPTVEDIRIAAEESLAFYAAKLLGYLKDQRIM